MQVSKNLCRHTTLRCVVYRKKSETFFLVFRLFVTHFLAQPKTAERLKGIRGLDLLHFLPAHSYGRAAWRLL